MATTTLNHQTAYITIKLHASKTPQPLTNPSPHPAAHSVCSRRTAVVVIHHGKAAAMHYGDDLYGDFVSLCACAWLGVASESASIRKCQPPSASLLCYMLIMAVRDFIFPLQTHDEQCLILHIIRALYYNFVMLRHTKCTKWFCVCVCDGFRLERSARHS